MSEYPRIIESGEEDFELNPEASSAWLKVDDMVLWIRRIEGGVIVEAYMDGKEMEHPFGWSRFDKP